MRNKKQKSGHKSTQRLHALPLRETKEWKDQTNIMRQQLRSLGFTEAEIERGVYLAEQQAMAMLRDTIRRRER